MPGKITYRAAAPADSFALAELSIMAGDGMFEFLLEEFAPKDMMAGLMAGSIRQQAGPSSWQSCFVAEQQGAGVVGMVNAVPAAWLRDEERDVLPQDRVQVLDSIDQAQEWESFVVSGVAVRATHRRQGVGKQLLAWAAEQSRVRGFGRLTANVWRDNLPACGLFLADGFRIQAEVPVAAHPALHHAGGSLLLVKEIG